MGEQSHHHAPFHFAVVGGGTAGWLTALILQSYARHENLNLRVTVIESSRIPTIGVGEGTTSVFLEVLFRLRIDVLEFIRETGATIKYGIRHENWRHLGHSYDGPIDDFAAAFGARHGIEGSWFNAYLVSLGKSATEISLFNCLMAKNKSPFAATRNGGIIPVNDSYFALHFDQARVGRFLRGKAEGIATIDAKVESVERDGGSNDISRLILDNGDAVAVDFVFDCTGFRRSLICGECGGSWKSYSKNLPVNRAMPFWLEHDADRDISPFTTANALGSGWLWTIPTQERLGCGYVYSDAFISPDQARAEVESKLGRPIEPRADIKIESGRLERAWIDNCLAIGLSQCFFEPLEATSIHGSIVQLMMFTTFHLESVIRREGGNPDVYNETVAKQANDFCDFISLHYISTRDDTEFWRHVASDCIRELVKLRLEHWEGGLPRDRDFVGMPGGFAHVGRTLYVPVLDGLGLLDPSVARKEIADRPKMRAAARRAAERYGRTFRIAAAKAIGHREFLRSVEERIFESSRSN